MSKFKNMFLQQTESLIKELLKIIPNDSNINLFKEKYYIIKKMNSSIILNSFIRYILPFKDKILDKNEQFFLDGGGQENLDDKYKYSLNLKENWGNLSDENKEVIWKYFQVLIVLSEKYVMESMN